MAKEQNLQTQILKWLRSKGCFAMKVPIVAGVPQGTADVFFCKEGFYGFLEVKASKNAKKQPHQDDFIKKMNEWSFASFVWPENWSQIKSSLEEIL